MGSGNALWVNGHDNHREGGVSFVYEGARVKRLRLLSCRVVSIAS